MRQRDVAVSGQLINESELLGDVDPAISKLLSIAAWRIHPSSDARYAMLAAARKPRDRRTHRSHRPGPLGGVQPRRQNPGQRKL